MGDHPLDHQEPNRTRNFLEARRQPAMVAQPGAAELLGALAHPGPGIFFMLSDVLDVAGEAEELHGLKTAAVHLLGDGQHRAGSHAQRPQTERAIAHRGIDKMNFRYRALHFPATEEYPSRAQARLSV